jgi:hypothetical protein
VKGKRVSNELGEFFFMWLICSSDKGVS